ncbi:uncharacterized protein ACNLHF_014075 [Anomaloglossus baeobatrachus]
MGSATWWNWELDQWCERLEVKVLQQIWEARAELSKMAGIARANEKLKARQATRGAATTRKPEMLLRDSQHLLGCWWDGSYYVDRCLPMGCSISCSYFEAFSSFVEWVVRDVSGLTSIIHYLDDFLCVGPAGSMVCAGLLFALQKVAASFGIPLAPDKTEGPAPVMCFLGIEIDTIAMECRLPAEKVRDLRSAVSGVKAAKKVRLKAVQSLLGKLNFACRIVPMGRVFARVRNLALLELFPIVVAVELWGSHFAGRKVCFHCDNQAVVHAINNLSAKSEPVVVYLRHLVLRCLQLNVQVVARHVPGVDNEVADALSRFQFSRSCFDSSWEAYYKIGEGTELNPELEQCDYGVFILVLFSGFEAIQDLLREGGVMEKNEHFREFLAAHVHLQILALLDRQLYI